MRILIVGNGAKELAAARLLDKNEAHDVLVVPGNAGTLRLEKETGNILDSSIPHEDVVKAAEFFKPEKILVLDEDWCLSPERKQLSQNGYSVFAPSEKSARLLKDKSKWTRYLKDHGLRTTDFALFDNYDDAYNLIQQTPPPWVMSEIGDGNRFTIVYTEEDATDALDEWFSGGTQRIIISEGLDGIRFNVLVLVWEDCVIPLGSTVIQRGVYEQEDDPETKGMGALSPAFCVEESIVSDAYADILNPFFQNMAKEGMPYTGFASGEFVAAEDGVYCVNLKCGLPDCGALSVFMRLESDLLNLLEQVENKKNTIPKWSDQTAAVVTMAASGYPDSSSVGSAVEIDEEFEGYLFPHRAKEDQGVMKTNGGRILFVGALGNTPGQAAADAVEACSHVHCEDLFYRTDIGDIQN